jgi:hypothetical protein
MFGKNIIRKSVTLVTVAAVWTVYSMVAFALPKDVAGEITVTGQVTVNGQPAVSNQTILSGAVIGTAAGSSAVVSLGKLGRVEVQENSNLSLNFSETGITATLNDGKAGFSTSAGISTSVATKHMTAIADMGQANNFFVQTACANSWVDTVSGLVTVREGSNDKQVAAGSSEMAGTMGQPGCKPCLRPDSVPGPAVAGGLWLLLLAAGVGAAAIFFAIGDDDTTSSGSVPIVSPTR